jgi:hypothetical protein
VAWLTFSPRSTHATVGIPGTGISYTETSRSHSHRERHAAPESQPPQTAEQRAAAEQASEVRGWFWSTLIIAGLGYVGWRIIGG